MLKSVKWAVGLSLVTLVAQAADFVPNRCGGYLRSDDDTRRVYADGRVYDRTYAGCWQNTGIVSQESFVATRDYITQNNTISSYGNSNTSIYSRQNSNTSIYSGATSNTTISGPGDSNTTIRNQGRINVTIEGGPATVRYSGSGNTGLSRNYYR